MECGSAFMQFVASLPRFLFEPSYFRRIEGQNGEITPWSRVTENIIGEFEKSPRLMGKLHTFDDEIDLLGHLFTNATVKKILGEYVAKCKHEIEDGTFGKKNASKASTIRLQGNQLFAKKEYLLAFKMYSRGLMFVKDEDEEAAILYANRSACFFHLDQYENALEDIERAFKLGYEKLKPPGKLLIRKGFSLLSLGRDDQVKEFLVSNLPTTADGLDIAQWKQLKKQSENVNRQIIKRDITMSQFQDVSKISAAFTPSVFSPHERFPWLNAKIDLRYDAGKGYYGKMYLVAKEDLKYGEIVALSKPFASLDPKRDSFERCHFCMVPCFESPNRFSDKPTDVYKPALSPDSVRMVTPIACTDCSNVLYCSEACRTKAWTSFHRFECKQMAVLSKMDSKAHLALRLAYMMGTLDVESPNQKLLREWNSIEDHLELMVNQEAYSFVFTSPLPKRFIFERTLEAALTVCFHLKLLQLSGLLPIASNVADLVCLYKAASICAFLHRHLVQIEVNGTLPFTDLILDRTITPSPVLYVDGMRALMENSCEAMVATSSLLTESFSSNVKLLYATGGIPAGSQLTLAYDTEEAPSVEQLEWRRYRLMSRYFLECPCTRCVRELGDCLDITLGTYFPIACMVCGELMVRSKGADDSYGCSTDGCQFKYSARQVETLYEQAEEMMLLKRKLFRFGHIIVASTQALPFMVEQLKKAIESTGKQLYGRSSLLANLYANLAQCYFVLLLNNTTSGYGYVRSSHLPASLLYTNKALDILEALDKGPCVKHSSIDRSMKQLLPMMEGAIDYCASHEKDQQLAALRPLVEQAKDRFEALLKMTAYDAMVASSLSAKE